jgi:colanic acid biosynthesis glycosyl transferase WcaI
MKRLWVVSELYYPEESATGYYLTRIAEGLARRFQVSVLCCQPTYAARGKKDVQNAFRNGVDIHRCWSTTFAKSNSLLRLVNVLTICISLFLKALRASEARDVFLVVTNPPLLPAFILVAAKLRGARCILLTHDVYPDVLASVRLLSKNSLLYKAAEFVGASIFRNMDMIFVLGRDMQTLVTQHLHKSKVPIQVITNWSDTEAVTPLPREDNSLLRELNLTAKFVVQYSGNIGRTHGIETIVETARRLRSHRDICFLFIGWGAKERWLKNTVRGEHLENILVLPPRPRDELHVSLNACDLAIVSFLPGMAGVSVPSRMYNILSAGKPLLAAADESSEVAMLVNEEQIGATVRPQDPQQFANAILALKSDGKMLGEMAMRARHAAETKYAESLILAKYVSALGPWLAEDAPDADLGHGRA